VAGTITASVALGAQSPDPNPLDDTASLNTLVIAPAADLGISLFGAPGPVTLGSSIAYNVDVTNAGPATATALTVSYNLAGYLVGTTNLGDLGSGLQTSFTIVATPTVAGTFTDSVSASSSVLDPLKANNS